MEKVAFVVRRARQEDIPQIRDVSKEAFSMYAEGAGISAIVGTLCETYEDLQSELQRKLVLVAESNETIVGCVRVEVNDDKTAYLSRFGVKAAYQSNGIGRLMMKAVDEYMIELGVEKLYLHTASRMLSLVRFYYARGFYIESTTKNRGYIRALLCKDYEVQETNIPGCQECENLAII